MLRNKGAKMIKESEHDIQKRFCDYMDFRKIVYFAIPNGIFLKDKRTAFAIARKMKAEGLKKGIPDLFIAHCTTQYAGLFIEMKTKTGQTSKEQKEWIERLEKQGYRATVCRGFNEAIKELENYLACYN